MAQHSEVEQLQDLLHVHHGFLSFVLSVLPMAGEHEHTHHAEHSEGPVASDAIFASLRIPLSSACS